MSRGSLRVYLGAAPGVGKTYAMLNEGRRRAERGTDVVVALCETHGRPLTAQQMAGLEVVPRRRLEHRGAVFEEMDVDAVLARRPQVALVDELAHTNVPGSRHEKRWQDVEAILAAGIDVISTVNVQHLESVNDVVERITGVVQRETLPDDVVRRADQVELVDMTPEAIRRRMAHGNIYPAEKVDAALANYFRPGNLAALRELALLWVADKVDESLQAYMEDHGITATWETRERVVVALTGAPGGEALIRRASRMATRARGDLLGVHVRSGEGLRDPRPELLDRHRRLLEELGGTFHEITAGDVATGLAGFARAEHATQLVLGASRRSWLASVLRGAVVPRLLRLSGDIDVHVISTAGDSEQVSLLPRPGTGLSVGRRRTGAALAVTLLPLLTAVLQLGRSSLTLTSDLMLYLVVVCVVAMVGGLWPAVVSAIGGFLLANWFFTPPIHTFAIGEPGDLVALFVFLSLGVLVSSLVTTAARRSLEATRRRTEAATLVRLAHTILTEADPVAPMLRQLRSAFGLRGASVLQRSPDGGWTVAEAVGDAVPARPEDATDTAPLDGEDTLALVGPDLGVEDRDMLQAFVTQLSIALESRALRAEAANAAVVAQADRLRTALLRAVSHDLRTPLASIKASVSTLLEEGLDIGPGGVRELHETIDDEVDRLTDLVTNLLAMSRLQAGAADPAMGAADVGEVVAGALVSLGGRANAVVVDVPEDLPQVHADPALLERAIANLVDNALKWSPASRSVRVEAGAVDRRVLLCVVDRGPGIPVADRDRVFQPFQRLGDASVSNGVGLGLAVARGFVEAMGGTITIDDTPGGGTTMVVVLRVAS